MIEPIGLQRKVNAQDEINMFLRNSVNVYQNIRRLNLDSKPHSHCRENLISYAQ